MKNMFLVLAIVLLAGAVGASPLHASTLIVPDSLNVSATPGLNPSAQPIFLNSSDGTGIPYTLTFSSDAGWLNVTPNTGTIGSSTIVNANIASFGLAQGLYSGQIVINAPSASNGPTFTIPVTLAVSNGPLILGTPSSLTFSGAQAGTAPTQTIAITNPAPGTLNYTVSTTTADGANWLSATPTSGSAPSTITVGVNLNGLAVGVFTGSVIITGNAGNSPKSIPVRLNVGQGAQLSLFPQSLTFNASVGQKTDPDPQAISVQNTAPGPLDVSYTASTNVTTAGCTVANGWLSASANGGSTPLAVTATVRLAGLSAGTYCGQITITPITGAVNGPQVVPVTLVVTKTPAIALSPSSLTFTAASGGAIPAAQTVQLTNSGGGVLSYSVAATTTNGGPWLSVANAGSVPANLSVTANSAGLAPGTYTGALTFTSPFAATSPVTLPVTLTVTGAAATGITLSPTSITFLAIPSGALPTPKTISVATASAGQSFTASATTTTGGNWLTVSPTSGTSPGTITASVTTTGLAAGTYSGTITVTSAGNANSPQTVAVTLRVTSTPIIVTDQASLTFATSAGVSPANQTLAFSVFGPGSLSYSYTATASTTSGGNWLTVNPPSGNGQATLSVGANAASLAAGTYNGTITLTSSSATNSPLQVPVTLTVSALGSLSANPGTLQLTGTPGGAAKTGTVNVTISGTSAASISAVAATSTGGNWLTATASSGTTPSTITVTANPASLAAGSYKGTVTITSTGAANSPLVVNVEFAVGAPQISTGGIVNGASFAPGAAVSAGGIVSLFGSNLAASTLSATTLPLPTTLGTTQVQVNGIPAPLFFVSSGQINFAIPWEVIGATSYQITVITNGVVSLAQTVTAAPQAPGIFSLNSSGSGPGAIQIANTAAIFAQPTGSIPGSAAQPVAVGQYISIFASGLGDVTNRPATGAAAGGSSTTVSTPSVTIGGLPAAGQFFFAGLSPGFVGLYQVNAQVPVGVQPGPAVQVQITVNGVKSNTVTIAVQ